MSDIEHSDGPAPRTSGSPSSTDAAIQTELTPAVPADPALPAAPESGLPAEAVLPPSIPVDAAAPLNVQERPKTKGVADIVFLIDVSGSMAPCIDALRKNIEAFIDSLSRGDANNSAPVRDWRGKVIGYRDVEASQAEGLPWIVDNAFVRDAGALKAQLSALEANGGGDEPESLLDALYTVAAMEAVPKGSQSEDPAKWRYRSDAARVVIVFTDASFKETMSIP
jgi:von Willebrand factor type A domain